MIASCEVPDHRLDAIAAAYLLTRCCSPLGHQPEWRANFSLIGQVQWWGANKSLCLVTRPRFIPESTHRESGPLSTRQHSHESARCRAAKSRSRKGPDDNRSSAHSRYRRGVCRDRRDRSLDPVGAAPSRRAGCRRQIHKCEDGQARSVMSNAVLGIEGRVAGCRRDLAHRKHFSAH